MHMWKTLKFEQSVLHYTGFSQRSEQSYPSTFIWRLTLQKTKAENRNLDYMLTNLRKFYLKAYKKILGQKCSWLRDMHQVPWFTHLIFTVHVKHSPISANLAFSKIEHYCMNKKKKTQTNKKPKITENLSILYWLNHFLGRTSFFPEDIRLHKAEKTEVSVIQKKGKWMMNL